MRKFSKKTVALVVSIALLLGVGLGGTLAYLIDQTDAVPNTFQPSQVSTYVSENNSGEIKKNVKIQNTGDIDANIRAAIVITWQNTSGQVLGQVPVLDSDYEIEIGDKWKLDNGFYVYEDVVEAGEFTEDLIVRCEPKAAAPVEGYFLCVEVIGSGIQSVGIPNDSHPWFN